MRAIAITTQTAKRTGNNNPISKFGSRSIQYPNRRTKREMFFPSCLCWRRTRPSHCVNVPRNGTLPRELKGDPAMLTTVRNPPVRRISPGATIRICLPHQGSELRRSAIVQSRVHVVLADVRSGLATGWRETVRMEDQGGSYPDYGRRPADARRMIERIAASMRSSIKRLGTAPPLCSILACSVSPTSGPRSPPVRSSSQLGRAGAVCAC
jgi:hypothetical protein